MLRDEGARNRAEAILAALDGEKKGGFVVKVGDSGLAITDAGVTELGARGNEIRIGETDMTLGDVLDIIK